MRSEHQPWLAPAKAFVRGHLPEVVLFAFGVALRLTLLWNNNPERGFDFGDHAALLRWYRDHGRWQLPFDVAPLLMFRESYHPPLYHFLAGRLLAHGSYKTVQSLGIALGLIRFAIFWLALERHVQRPLARRFALALGAILPTWIHADAMLTNETLNMFFATAAMFLMLEYFRANRDRARWRVGVALGLALALGMLSKVSSLMLVLVFAIGAAHESLHTADGWRARVRRALPSLVVAAELLILAGPYFARNTVLYGKPFLSGWDGADRYQLTDPRFMKTPLPHGRPLGFYVGWSNDIYASPYYPSGTAPTPTFFPVLVASTFVDFYNYGFCPSPTAGQSTVMKNSRVLRAGAVLPSRLSALGGTWIALVTFVAWSAASRHAWRTRNVAALVLLTLPLLAVIGQATFAARYPLDNQGLIKGIYLGYVAAPLIALFGIAATWFWDRRRSHVLLVPHTLALLGVASYVVYCRFS